MPTSSLTRADMLLSTTLGCQRRQKATPKRLPEVGLSLVQLTSVHIAAAAPVSSSSALVLLAELWCTVGPADRLCWTTSTFWTSFAGRWRKCRVRHLATMTAASINIVHAGRGSGGHHQNSCIPTIGIITCCLQTPNICIDSSCKKNSRRTVQVAHLCKLDKLSLCLQFTCEHMIGTHASLETKLLRWTAAQSL